MLFVHLSACSSLGTNYIRRYPASFTGKIYLVRFCYLLQPYMEEKLHTLLTPIPASCLVARDQPICKRRSSFQTSTQVNGIFTWSSNRLHSALEHYETPLMWPEGVVHETNRYVTWHFNIYCFILCFKKSIVIIWLRPFCFNVQFFCNWCRFCDIDLLRIFRSSSIHKFHMFTHWILFWSLTLYFSEMRG